MAVINEDGVASWFCCGPDAFPGSCCPCQPSTNCCPCPPLPDGSCPPSCCPSNGACETCHSDLWMCAWQNLPPFPGCNCRCPPPVTCGQLLSVSRPCVDPGVRYVMEVADHGPGACSAAPTDCSGQTSRLIDLTPAGFVQLGDLSVGLIAVNVNCTALPLCN